MAYPAPLNRTTTSSTASTMYSYAQPSPHSPHSPGYASSYGFGGPDSPATTVPPSAYSAHSAHRKSPSLLSPAMSSPSRARFSRMNSTDSGQAAPASASAPGSPDDELDKLGYMYSLRVAVLQHRLQNAPAPTPMSPTSPTSPTSPNVSRFSVSSAGSRFTMNGNGAMNGLRSPEIPPPTAEEEVVKRKKSGLRLSIGGSKNELKLPKEFLLEFWDTLKAEEGDSGWLQAVRGLMLLVQKKGTKTSNANLREIPALLQTFATCLPPPGPNCAPPQEHRAHLLRLLYHALPTSTYFSTSKSDKDKDLMARLRTELQTQMYQSFEPEAEFSPTLMANGMAARANGGMNRGSPGLSPGMQSMQNMQANGFHRPASGQVQDIRRKPSPQWEDDAADTSGLVGIVGLVWGVSPYVLENDVHNLKRFGTIEKLYLADLKAKLTVLARANDAVSHQRCSMSSDKLAQLLSVFPELTRPASPGTGFAQASNTPQEAFFTPPRKGAVFATLLRRAAEGGNTIRAAELLEACQNIWEVESRAEKEREVEGLCRRWQDSFGTDAEVENGNRLARAVADLAEAVMPSEPLPRILDHIRSVLLDQLSKSLHAIFPTTALPPPSPPPSLIPLFAAAPSILLRSRESAKALTELSEELQGAAVGEYVMAASEMGVHQCPLGTRTGESGKDVVVEAFEMLAAWVNDEVSNVHKAWGTGLGAVLDPASIIIRKQLPLFLAEIQVLETSNGAASDVFHLYEVTSRLLALWERLCPGREHGFDIDAFFEPHVMMWLRETEANETYQWVARTIGMDEWIPEGEGRYSQSVTDLFEFIRNATQMVRDLPLSEYKRAVFLIDLSKTASIAVGEYAKSVHMLFQTDMAPKVTSTTKEAAASNVTVGGKAGAWLAKGRHAVQKVENKIHNKPVDGFIVPAAALVKMTNMSAARAALEDVGFFMEADECARVVRERKLQDAIEQPTSHRFSVTLLRGQNLLTLSRSAKPADALVHVTDTVTGERLFKSRTVLESEDPKWDSTFEVTIPAARSIEVTVLDRQLVGKHDVIGSRSLKLDPALFADNPVRDIVLPLSPRGVVHLRVSLAANSVFDVNYHLTAASRVLDNTGADMMLEIVDRMAEYLRVQLSRSTLNTITKPLRDRKRGRVALTESEIDASLVPVFDYFDVNFALFKETLTPPTCTALMVSIWQRTVDILLSLLIPPLSERPASNTILSPPEIDVVFKWLQQIKAFFNAAEGGVEHGVPLSQLQTGGYKDMLMVGQYLDLPTPALRERAAAAVKAAATVQRPASTTSALRSLSLNPAPVARSRVGEDNERMAEVLLRILRTRPDTQDFLSQQIGELIKAKVDRQRGML